MENLSVGGNPLLQFEDKLVEHKTKFTWLFIIMAVVILILVIVVIWFAATKKSEAPAAGTTPAVTQGFNASFNQVDFSGVTGNTSTNETGYNKFAERLNPGSIGPQGFDIDPRNSLQKRFDGKFEQGGF